MKLFLGVRPDAFEIVENGGDRGASMVTGFDLLALVRGACPGSDARWRGRGRPGRADSVSRRGWGVMIRVERRCD